MIQKVTAQIISRKEIAQDTVELVLKNDHISAQAQPGQFVHIKVREHTLRRPISIADVNRKQQTVTLLFKIVGSGTQELANYSVGAMLDLLGPNGTAYPIVELKAGDSALLIGGGIGVPPLYFLAKHLAEMKVNVQAILGFQTAAHVFYAEAFARYGDVTIVTDDGSYGKQGLVTDYISVVKSFTHYYSCGPLPMLRAVKASLPDKVGYLSFEQRMACGIGACYACVIPTGSDGKYKKICQDGPVFAANEVKI